MREVKEDLLDSNNSYSGDELLASKDDDDLISKMKEFGFEQVFVCLCAVVGCE